MIWPGEHNYLACASIQEIGSFLCFDDCSVGIVDFGEKVLIIYEMYGTTIFTCISYCIYSEEKSINLLIFKSTGE